MSADYKQHGLSAECDFTLSIGHCSTNKLLGSNRSVIEGKADIRQNGLFLDTVARIFLGENQLYGIVSVADGVFFAFHISNYVGITDNAAVITEGKLYTRCGSGHDIAVRSDMLNQSVGMAYSQLGLRRRT